MRLEIENEWKREATHTRDFQNEPTKQIELHNKRQKEKVKSIF